MTDQDSRLEEIAKAAAEINTMSSEEAFEAIVEGINKVPEQLQAMIDSVVAIQFDWPMPEEGWKLFVEDVERTNERLGLNLHVNPPDHFDPLNIADALEKFAASIDKTRDELDDTEKMQAMVNAVLAQAKEKEMGHPILVGDSEYRQELLKCRNEVGGNMFGLVLHYDEATSKYTPITCSHGGSGWLCPACAVRIISGGAVERLEKAKTLIQEQAGDEGLWFIPQCATEVYLQNALRKLQAVIEGEE